MSEYTALRRLFRIVNGGTPTSDEANWNGDVFWATPADLAPVHGGSIAGTARTLTRVGLSSGSAAVPDGSLLLSTRAPIGYVAATTTETSFNQGCRGLVTRTELDLRFFRYQLLARQADLVASGQGSTFTELSSDGLAAFKVRAPSLAAQRAIADFLDAETARIDALMETKQRMIALLALRFGAEAAKRTLAGLDPVGGFGVLPVGWRRPRLGVAIELHRGFDLPNDDRRDGSVPVVSSGGVSGWHDVPACQPPGVVTGRYGTVGGVHFVDDPYWPLNTTLFVCDFRGNDPRWVYHLLRLLPLNIDAEKSAVTGINRNVVGQLYAPLPPVAVQRDIARGLDLIEARQQAVVERLRTQLSLLREHRQALITSAVTGQLDLAKAAS